MHRSALYMTRNTNVLWGAGELGASDELLAESLNMGSALMHVLSDSLRSITTLIEALLIFLLAEEGDGSSALFDAWATLVVAGLVIVATVPPLGAWVCSLRNMRWDNQTVYEPLPDNAS